MPSAPTMGLGRVLRLFLATALLCLACGELSANGDNDRLKPEAAQIIATHQWSSTAALTASHSQYTAPRLSAGQVLIPEGVSLLTNVEVYDPVTETWYLTSPLHTARHAPMVVQLPTGQVLVAGGLDEQGTPLSSAEVYDPAMGQWTYTAPMSTARVYATATLLSTVEILVTGGTNGSQTLASSEVYNPTQGQWTTVGSLTTGRKNHYSTLLLPCGNILAVWGVSDSGVSLSSVEEYVYRQKRWEERALETIPRPNSFTVLLPMGQVLVIADTCQEGSLPSPDEDDETGSTTRPVLEPLAVHGPGTSFFVQGRRFIGASNSPPVVRVQSLIPGVPFTDLLTTDYSDTSVKVTLPNVPSGKYLLFVLAAGVSNGQVLIIDAIPPQAPRLSAPPFLVSDRMPVIAGKVEPWSTVTVSLDGLIQETTQANSAGLWILAPTTELAEGVHFAVATATDTAGNISPPSQTRIFTVDTVPPEAPKVIMPVGFVGGFGPTIAGTAEPGTSVTVSLDGTQIGTTLASAGGHWIFIPAIVLADGPHWTTITATDAANNVSPPSRSDFTVDTAPPVAPELYGPATVINTSFPVVAGTAEPGGLVTVWVDNVITGIIIADAAGIWSLIPAIGLAEGLHSVKATVSDIVGNVSDPSPTHNFAIDFIPGPPGAPELNVPAFTNNEKLVITGTAEPRSKVLVWIDGLESGTVNASPDGLWTFTPGTSLAHGEHQIMATAMDVAGNVSQPSSTHSFIVITQRSHYGWGCSSSLALPVTWALLVLAGALSRRRLRAP